MKNLSLVFNVILAVAVAVLYFLHFSSKEGATSNTSGSISVTQPEEKPILLIDSNRASLPVVFINIDSLNKKYKYIEILSKEAQKKMQAQEKAFVVEKSKVQEEYRIFMENYQGGVYKSQAQIEERERYFAQKQQDLARREYELESAIEKEMIENNAKIMKKVSGFLANYSNELNYSYILATGGTSSVLFANDSLDITNPVLEGLNAEYKK